MKKIRIKLKCIGLYFLSFLLAISCCFKMGTSVFAEELVNVAKYGIAYADSENNPASFLNDGNTSNLWIAASSSCPASAGIKLDGIYDVNSVKFILKSKEMLTKKFVLRFLI